MLKKPSGYSCLMIKTPLKLMRKSVSTPIFFLILILLNYFIITFMVCPCKNLQCLLIIVVNDLGWFIAISVFFGLSLLFFILSAFADPGYLKKPK